MSYIQIFLRTQWKNLIRSVGSELINVLLTALSGFVMIQHLSKDVYGVYGFIVTAVNLIVALSEVGINHCYLPLVGYTNVTAERIRAVSLLFKKKRTRLLYVSVSLVILPVLYLFYQKGWLNVVYVFSIILMLVGAALAVNEQLKRQEFSALHNSRIIARSNSLGSIVRTVWILLSVYLLPENVLIISLSMSGGVGSLFALWIYNSVKGSGDESIGKLYFSKNYSQLNSEFKKVYDPLKLPAFLYVLYANFGGMIIGWFGNTTTMANVNAAGRLGMCLIIVDKLVGIFIIPKLAQAPTSAKYIDLLNKSLIAYVVFVALIVLSAWLMPQLWILLIGHKYTDLQDILWLCFLGVVLSNFSGFLFTCMSARGFTSNQLPIFLSALCAQIIAIYFLGMYTAKSVFLISVVTSFVFSLGNLLLLIIRVKHLKILQK